MCCFNLLHAFWRWRGWEEVFFVPPYVGPSGWLGIRLDLKPEWPIVSGIVEDAYRLAAPKKLLNKLDS